MEINKGRHGPDGDAVGPMVSGVVRWVPPRKCAGGCGCSTMNINHVEFSGLIQGSHHDRFAIDGDLIRVRFEDCGLGAMKEDSKATSTEFVDGE